MPVTVNTTVPVGTAETPWVTVAVNVTGEPVTAPDDSVTAVLRVGGCACWRCQQRHPCQGQTLIRPPAAEVLHQTFSPYVSLPPWSRKRHLRVPRSPNSWNSNVAKTELGSPDRLHATMGRRHRRCIGSIGRLSPDHQHLIFCLPYVHRTFGMPTQADVTGSTGRPRPAAPGPKRLAHHAGRRRKRAGRRPD